MTCVVGMVHKGKMILGADSAGVTSNFHLEIRRDSKVHALAGGRVLMGFSGSFRGGQILAHRLSVPRMRGDGDAYRYMAIEFVDAMRQCFKDHGYATISNAVETHETHAIVATEGRLFKLYNDYQVGEYDVPYAAIGCGQEIALGALHATEGSKLGARKRLEVALSAAEQWSAGVRGPFRFVGE